MSQTHKTSRGGYCILHRYMLRYPIVNCKKEPFDIIQFSAFVIIWIGLIFFTYGELADIRNMGKEHSSR